MSIQTEHVRWGKARAVCIALLLLFVSACDSILDTQPQSSLDESLLANEEGVEKLLIAAYAALDGTSGGGSGTAGGWYAAEDNWMWGSVGADDAHKGSSPGDQSQISTFEMHTADETSSGVWRFWRTRYDGVARTNAALRLMKQAADMSPAAKTQVEAEARFLRAHYHFELKRMFNNIPYITEDLEDTRVPNTTDVWPQIEADLAFAVSNLPLTQADVGRPTQWAAKAYLAKVHLYQQDLLAADPLFDDVIGNGPYDLRQCYADMFNAEFDNNEESVFEVQASVNDGSSGSGLGRTGAALNFPYSFGPGKCCGFFQPSQDFVNAFKVDPATGLPMPDTYNEVDFKNDYGLVSTDAFTPDMDTPVDPRLDWSVGRRGVPYLDWGLHPGQNAIRQQGFGGPYSPIKNVYYKRHEGTLSTSSGGSAQHNANNYSVIRFADVLLMAAEVKAELGDLEQARVYVNRVRERADGCVVRHEDGTPAANYRVGVYEEPWGGLEEARAAIRFERRLELGMEGHRFFDLVRWGVAQEVLNAYYQSQVAKANAGQNGRSYFAGASLEAHEIYYPIPEQEIRRSAVEGVPVLVQNPGY